MHYPNRNHPNSNKNDHANTPVFRIEWIIKDFLNINQKQISQANLCNTTKVNSILIFPQKASSKLKFRCMFQQLPKSVIPFYNFTLKNKNPSKDYNFERRVDVEDIINLPFHISDLTEESGFLQHGSLHIHILIHLTTALRTANPLTPPVELISKSGVFHVCWTINRNSNQKGIYHSPSYLIMNTPAWFLISLPENFIEFTCIVPYVATIHIGNSHFPIKSSQKLTFQDSLSDILFSHKLNSTSSTIFNLASRSLNQNSDIVDINIDIVSASAHSSLLLSSYDSKQSFLTDSCKIDGILNHKTDSFMIVIFHALYNIPAFKNSLFMISIPDFLNPITSLQIVFAKMQILLAQHETINFDFSNFPTRSQLNPTKNPVTFFNDILSGQPLAHLFQGQTSLMDPPSRPFLCLSIDLSPKLQDTLNGFSFSKVPPILVLQIARIGSDLQMNESRCEYPEELQVKEEINGHPIPISYTLYSIIVHCGKGSFGHYFIYIKHQMKQWKKCIDMSVTDQKPNFSDTFEGATAAHDLFYVRTSEIPNLFTNDIVPIPKHIESLANEIGLNDRFVTKFNSDNSQESVNVRLFTEKTFNNFDDFITDSGTITVSRNISYAKLYTIIATKFSIDVDYLRLWYCSITPNSVSYPRSIIPNVETAHLSSNLEGGKNDKFISIYCQRKNPNETLDIGNGSICLIAKAFNGRSFHYLDTFFCSQNEKPITISKKITEQYHIQITAIYEKKNRLNPEFSLKQHMAKQFSIYTFQGDFPEHKSEIVDGNEILKIPPAQNMQQYIDQNNIILKIKQTDFSLQICPSSNDPEQITLDSAQDNASVFTTDKTSMKLKISANCTLEQVKKALIVAKKLKYNPEKNSVLLFRHDPITNRYRRILPDDEIPTTIYYRELSKVPEKDVDIFTEYIIQISSDARTISEEITATAPRSIKCEDLYKFLPPLSFKYRFVEVVSDSLRILNETDKAPSVLRIEKVLLDQIGKPLASVAFAKKPGSYLPSQFPSFFIRLISGETIADLKQRLKEEEGLNDNWSKVTACFDDGPEQVLNDDTVLFKDGDNHRISLLFETI